MTTETTMAWRRSQRCDNGECVEVASLPAGVALRDSTRPDGPVLRFTPADWTAFVTDLRSGRLPTA